MHPHIEPNAAFENDEEVRALREQLVAEPAWPEPRPMKRPVTAPTRAPAQPSNEPFES